MAYMVAGYLIIWLAAFAFIFSMVQRQRSLQREIEVLKQMANQPQRPEAQVGGMPAGSPKRA